MPAASVGCSSPNSAVRREDYALNTTRPIDREPRAILILRETDDIRSTDAVAGTGHRHRPSRSADVRRLPATRATAYGDLRAGKTLRKILVRDLHTGSQNGDFRIAIGLRLAALITSFGDRINQVEIQTK